MSGLHGEHGVVNESADGVVCRCGVLVDDIHVYAAHLIDAAGPAPPVAQGMVRIDREFGRPMHYDREGHPLTWWEWAVLFEDHEYRRIGSEYMVGATEFDMDDDTMLWVSTVWLGNNMNWRDGPPIIYETMIFDGPYAGELTRYATDEQARQGHSQTVADLAAGRAPWFLRDAMEESN